MLPALPDWIDPTAQHAERRGVLLAAHDRLHLDGEAGGLQHRVDAQLRARAVRTAAVEAELEAVGAGGEDAGPVGDRPAGAWAHVLGEADGGPREAGEQAVVQHRPRAADRLLRRLADEHQRAVPLALQGEQGLRRAHPGGHVDVVAAAVIHRRRLALPGLHRVAGVGQAGLLFHGKRVELGADQDGRPLAVLVDGDDPGAAHVLGDLEAQVAHLLGELGGGGGLLEGQLRMLVDVLIERVEAAVAAVEPGVDLGLLLGDVSACRPGRRRRTKARPGAAGAGDSRNRTDAGRHGETHC